MIDFRVLALNGGMVSDDSLLRFWLPIGDEGYADAQIDDYGEYGGRDGFRWQAGVSLQLRARFSHEADELKGTAGFGFSMHRRLLICLCRLKGWGRVGLWVRLMRVRKRPFLPLPSHPSSFYSIGSVASARSSGLWCDGV